MTDEFIRVIPNRDVVPVNRIVKAEKYREDESGGGGGSFASMLEQETRKKEKASAEGKAPEKLKKMDGMNQYDARANAFFYRLNWTADYRA